MISIGNRTIKTITFPFHARMHRASDWQMFIWITLFIYVPLFFYFWVLYLGTATSTGLNLLTGLVVLFAALTSYHHVCAVFCNPGILTQGHPMAGTAPTGTSPNALVGDTVWCCTCRIYRPPRASHCSHCDVCILEFDHHCGVLGCCVGQYNLRHFMGFAYFIACLAWSLLSCVVFIQFFGEPSSEDVSKNGRATCSIVIGLICMYVGLGLSALSAYYCWLLYQNRTYKEHVRNKPIPQASSKGQGGFFHYAAVVLWHSINTHEARSSVREVV